MGLARRKFFCEGGFLTSFLMLSSVFVILSLFVMPSLPRSAGSGVFASPVKLSKGGDGRGVNFRRFNRLDGETLDATDIPVQPYPVPEGVVSEMQRVLASRAAADADLSDNFSEDENARCVVREKKCKNKKKKKNPYLDNEAEVSGSDESDGSSGDDDSASRVSNVVSDDDVDYGDAEEFCHQRLDNEVAAGDPFQSMANFLADPVGAARVAADRAQLAEAVSLAKANKAEAEAEAETKKAKAKAKPAAITKNAKADSVAKNKNKKTKKVEAASVAGRAPAAKVGGARASGSAAKKIQSRAEQYKQLTQVGEVGRFAYLGKSRIVCPFCYALLYYGEVVNSNGTCSFKCCKNGRVKIDVTWKAPPFVEKMFDPTYIPSSLAEASEFLGRDYAGTLDGFRREWARCAEYLRARTRPMNMAFQMASHLGKFQPKFPGQFEPGYNFSGMAGAVLTGDISDPHKTNLLWLDPASLREVRDKRVGDADCPSLLYDIGDHYFRTYNTIVQDLLRVREQYAWLGKTALKEGEASAKVDFRLFTGKDRILAQPDEVEGFIPSGASGAANLYTVEIKDTPGVQFINYETGLAFPMRYPLAFGEGRLFHRHGDPYSFMDYCKYALQTRVDPETNLVVFNPLLHMGYFSQQVICEMWAFLEQERVRSASHFIAKNAAARTTTVFEALSAVRSGVGGEMPDGKKRSFLSDKHSGTYAYKRRHAHNAISMFRKYGDPDLFITMTCNPNWPEFKEYREMMEASGIKYSRTDPSVMYRVFELKVRKLMEVLLDNSEQLGEVQCYVFSIEYQARGLPHAHILLSFKDGHKVLTAADVDRLVSAELPGKATEQDRKLREIICRWNLHECREKCMKKSDPEKKKCGFDTKYFTEATVIDETRVEYKRRDNTDVKYHGYVSGALTKPHVAPDGTVFTNQKVVPYNARLSLLFDCHINVEVCRGPGATRYLCKYLTKGLDQGVLEMNVLSEDDDVVTKYLRGRVIQPCEAVQKLLGFASIRQSHPVHLIPLHLDQGQRVVYTEHSESQDATLQSLRDGIANLKPSMLQEYFEYNRTCDCEDPAKTMNILAFAEAHTFATKIEKVNGLPQKVTTWRKRSRLMKNPTIARFSRIPIENIELFSMRVLLQSAIAPTSFIDLRTVTETDGSRVVYPTFREALLARSSDEADRLWNGTLEEAVQTVSGSQLRSVFAMLLVHGLETHFQEQWNKWKHFLCADKAGKKSSPSDVPAAAERLALADLESILREYSRKLEDYGIRVDGFVGVVDRMDVDYDLQSESQPGADVVSSATLNKSQRAAFGVISELLGDLRALKEGSFRGVPEELKRVVFVDGPAGTGKSHLLKAVISHAVELGLKVHTVAATGVAASVYDDATTAHYRFHISLADHPEIQGSWKPSSESNRQFRETDVYIWDEVLCQSKRIVEKVDEFLREMTGEKHLPFGGKIVIFGGDCRQAMPIVNDGSDPMDNHFFKSALYERSIKLRLTQNMRVDRCLKAAVDALHEKEILWYADYLLDVADNTVLKKRGDIIDVPDLLLSDAKTFREFVLKLYPLADFTNGEYISRVCALAMTHMDKDEINKLAVKLALDNKLIEFRKYESRDCDHTEIGTSVAAELLRGKKSSGMPDGVLELGVGVPVILMRNCPSLRTLGGKKIYLGNGTRCLVVALGRDILTLRVCAGKHKGEDFHLPRFRFVQELTEIRGIMTRVQFPVQIAYAITVNKSQSLTLEKTGLYLRGGAFAHGQLYVALSRVGDPRAISIFIEGGLTETTNIVEDEIAAVLRQARRSERVRMELSGEGEFAKRPSLCAASVPTTKKARTEAFELKSRLALLHETPLKRKPLKRPPLIETPAQDRMLRNAGRANDLPIGLKNPRWACFMNAALQSLRYTHVPQWLMGQSEAGVDVSCGFSAIFQSLSVAVSPFDAYARHSRAALKYDRHQLDPADVYAFLFNDWGGPRLPGRVVLMSAVQHPQITEDVIAAVCLDTGVPLDFSENELLVLNISRLVQEGGVQYIFAEPRPLPMHCAVGGRSLTLKSVLYSSGRLVEITEDDGQRCTTTRGHFVSSIKREGLWYLIDDEAVSVHDCTAPPGFYEVFGVFEVSE
jgi:hypothetical protein